MTLGLVPAQSGHGVGPQPALADPLGQGRVLRVRQPQRFSGDRVQTGAVQVRHLLLLHRGAVAETSACESLAKPAAGRIAALGVVLREWCAARALHIPAGRVAKEIRVAGACTEPMH